VRRSKAAIDDENAEKTTSAESETESCQAGVDRLKQLNYLDFMKATIPPHWSSDASHIRLIASYLDLVLSGSIDRLAIHMPPRHGKSETVTHRLPLKWLIDKGEANVLVTGYNERFARRLGRRARSIAAQYAPVGFLSSDKKASDEWETSVGGSFMARGVGAPPTGVGFSLIVIDDPIKRREEADSQTNRESIWEWYSNDIYTRLEPGGAIVLVMTRWHEDDLGAQATLSEPERWTVLKLSAIAEENDLMGRKPGEALWPGRYGTAELKRIESVLSMRDGSRAWLSLYQQNPTPREGMFFRTNQIQLADACDLPPMTRQNRAWDIASTAGGGDYTCGVLMGVDEIGRYYVLDVTRGQWATDVRNDRIRKTAIIDGKRTSIHGPQDPSAAGKDAALAFTRLLAGFTVHTEPVSGSKELRADPFSAQVNAGNVTLLRGDWNSAFIEELRTFPRGKHDDQVDAASDCFLELAFPDDGAQAVARPVYAAVHRRDG